MTSGQHVTMKSPSQYRAGCPGLSQCELNPMYIREQNQSGIWWMVKDAPNGRVTLIRRLARLACFEGLSAASEAAPPSPDKDESCLRPQAPQPAALGVLLIQMKSPDQLPLLAGAKSETCGNLRPWNGRNVTIEP